MELGLSNTLLAGDPRLVDHIVGEVKSQGIFDQFRKECIADVDTKPAYQNLHTRVEGSVNSFLSKQSWKPDLNKNQLRETLRKQINEAPYLDAGVERIVDQVVNPKIYSVFMPQIEDVVYKFLGIERPKARERNGACGLKDLLPKDLDPVSPESDKNSLKDVSLESMDGIEDLEMKKEAKLTDEQKSQREETSNEKSGDNASENEQVLSEEKTLDGSDKTFNKTGSNLNLNTFGKSDDKTEEDEEDSPTFEPIDIMNLNESNNSNDSHLSGISELTSHRSGSPDFCNELSRDNFEYSNQDSHLSKVSSDSRLSIVTDLGSSNPASTPFCDMPKDEASKDKCDVKSSSKDNFKPVKECDSSKNKSNKNIFELNKGKDVQDGKDSKSIKSNLSSKENSRDATDSSVKEKYENKSKERSRDSESKLKSKDKNCAKDGKHHRDRSSDKKKERSHSSSKYEKYDKSKSKDKNDQPKEIADGVKDAEKDTCVKTKETDGKDNVSKESKDLKDLYKEKIRELREKKELTEKEKLNKDVKESNQNKENKDKKDSLKDKKPYKKDSKTSSRSTSSSSHELKTSKSSEKIVDEKKKRSESKDKDKNKRDERRSSKDHSKLKNSIGNKSDSTERLDKQDVKKSMKNEKEEKNEKAETKKSSSEKVNGSKREAKNHAESKGSARNEKLDRKDSKNDLHPKDKKRREEKKSKSKDDHSSLRRNSNDRRSTDRDGSNGSSSKSSQSNNSGSNIASKSSTSGLTKETNHVNNSGSETSDNIEEVRTSDMKSSNMEEQSCKSNKGAAEYKADDADDHETQIGPESEMLPLKKRALSAGDDGALGDIKLKKPKFAKNFHEAKKLMKIRKQIEKQKLKETKKLEKRFAQRTEDPVQANTLDNETFESMPDEERVQIIEVPDEEYEEPYPEKQSDLTLEERSIMMLQTEAGTKDMLETRSDLKLKLPGKELCVSLNDKTLEEESTQQSSSDTQTNLSDNKGAEESQNKRSLSPVTEERDNNAVVKTEKIDETEECVESLDRDIIKEEENIKSEEESESSSAHVDDASCSKDVVKYSGYDDDPSNDTSKGGCIRNVKEEPRTIESTSTGTDDNGDCRYFKADSEKWEKFSSFLESLELMENSSLEEMIESLGGQIVSSMPKAMAPPLPKRKLSSSPLTDILLNNSNNNNDGHKKVLDSTSEETLTNMKKRKLIPPKKQRLQPNICTPQVLLNGENFVMPLSPESDVSATSEKIPSSNTIKEDKSRHRSSQRYSSDDLYKPRPLFSSSSRRSRRSNQV
ncbi:biorientation of chromosomes in cell division protein 1-like 1 [Ceratina calcarata]|uniref:Biorientation of chromosomes in cell division protein 1-like 1 n=1 Tax=Ceratina calcarata TaxID=156304 RepID=A0AAJ7SC77_9HYME|nr:biorientation of chromosomes in cell division protein 1-like 1 [Ceratina calcarata]